jgi:basic amino acid/polyamine antiporter, APA family
MAVADQQPPTRLARRLGTFDAVVIGLGSMIGAGVFVAFAPAAEAAGSGLLLGLAIAGFVSLCNATSSAQLAALYPESGGTYVYGRERLGHFWGYLAGWSFVVGKSASCAAIALTFGAYVDPDLVRPLGVGAVVALTTINYLGVQKTAAATRIIVAAVLASLAAFLVAVAFGGSAEADRLTPLYDEDFGLKGVLESAGLLFFAFAGYARIATLGEEVRDPEVTIPRATLLAFAIAFLVYLVVAFAVLAGLGPELLATSEAPLADAVTAGDLESLEPVVRTGAVVATLGVLISLLAGVSRTLFAMASNQDMPSVLSHVHGRRLVPDYAQVALAAVVIAVVLAVDLRGAIGFSSFAVLLYYAVANASALTLAASERRWPLSFAAAGFAGCIVLAFTLPWETVVAGAAVVAAGALFFVVKERLA